MLVSRLVTSQRQEKALVTNYGNSFRLIFFYGLVLQFVTFVVGRELSLQAAGDLLRVYCEVLLSMVRLAHVMVKAVGILVR